MINNGNSSFWSFATVVTVILVAGSILFWPNRTRGLWGRDEPDETIEEQRAERERQIIRCRRIIKGMENASVDLKKLSAEARYLNLTVTRLKRKKDVDREKFEASEMPELLATVKTQPDELTMSDFGSYDTGIRSACQKIIAEADPAEYAGLIAKAEATLDKVKESNERRWEASRSLRDLFEH